MKCGKDKPNQSSIIQPLVQDLFERARLDSAKQNPTIGSESLPPASLFQDAGNGYNPDFTFPQE